MSPMQLQNLQLFSTFRDCNTVKPWKAHRIYFFKKFFQEHYQSVKQFGSRSDLGPSCSQRLSADAKVATSKERVTPYAIATIILIIIAGHRIAECVVYKERKDIERYRSLVFFRNTIRVSNSLDQDQDQHSVGPDLGPNCSQRLSADDKSRQ